MSGGGGEVSSGSRFLIPSGVRKTILDIKEIAAGRHTDDDIYTVLKECNMDPNETVQKLLYLDTFHEVKKKREKRNVNVGRASEEYRSASGMQRQGSRGSRKNYPSSNVFADSGGRNQVSAQDKNGINNYAKRHFKPSAAFLNKGEKNAAPSSSNGQTASEIMNSASTTGSSMPQDVGINQPCKPLQGLSKACDGTDEQVCGPSEVVASQSEAVMIEDNVPLPPPSSFSVPDQATVELDKKLEKLSISIHRPVIFPDHLQVPEDLRKGLTFGSLDTCLGQSANCELVSTVSTENISASNLSDREPALSNHCGSATEEEGEEYNFQPSHPSEFEQWSTSGDRASSTGAEKFDKSKQDTLAPKGGLPDPLLQAVSEYGFGFMPPVVGSHLLHVEVAEPQGVNSVAPSTSCSSPPLAPSSGLAQSSFAFPPQLLPFVRQPYPPSFIPYNPYFPPLYMPHNPHQFIGHNVLPQQPVAANLNVPPTAATKLPVPALYRMGTVAGNLTQFGIPSSYGSYGASAVGYVPSQASTSCSSAGNEDLAAAELKEKTTFSELKQGEESQAWSSAPGRDISTLQANYFYNIPPGQRVVFSPAHPGHGTFPGVYNLSQTMVGPSNIQSLPQQLPATDGSVESVIPTSNHLQPHPQFNWNSRMLNRENI